MKRLQILGTGCAKCTRLAEHAESAARAMGVPYSIEKITGLQQIMEFGVMVTPALVVNGVVKVAGRVPDVESIKAMLR